MCHVFRVSFLCQFGHGWTILSNNFALAVITMSSNTLSFRINSEIHILSEDYHKIITYETMLLLSETAQNINPPDRDKVLDRVRRFYAALLEGDTFSQPGYIDVSSQFKTSWDSLTTMQIISSI